jgi:hypothetical protein
MIILYYGLLDFLQSLLNRSLKTLRERRKWGPDWRDKTRSGRRYTRVETPGYTVDSIGITIEKPRIRLEPGWEWSCPNCKTYSLITESDMGEILRDWEEMAQRCKDREMPIPKRPTMATAGCTNCRFRPGAPE